MCFCGVSIDDMEPQPWSRVSNHVVCMVCGAVSTPIHLPDNTGIGCSILFCHCYRGRSATPACRICRSVFPKTIPRVCRRCNVRSFVDTRFCINCGMERNTYYYAS